MTLTSSNPTPGKKKTNVNFDYYRDWFKRNCPSSDRVHLSLLENLYKQAGGALDYSGEVIPESTFRDHLRKGKASPDFIQKLMLIANHRTELHWIELRPHLQRSWDEHQARFAPLPNAEPPLDEGEIVPYSPEQMAELKANRWRGLDPRRAPGKTLLLGANRPTTPRQKLSHLAPGDVPDAVYTGARVVCRALAQTEIEGVALDEGQLFTISATHWVELLMKHPDLAECAERIGVPTKAQALEGHQCFISAHLRETKATQPRPVKQIASASLVNVQPPPLAYGWVPITRQ